MLKQKLIKKIHTKLLAFSLDFWAVLCQLECLIDPAMETIPNIKVAILIFYNNIHKGRVKHKKETSKDEN